MGENCFAVLTSSPTPVFLLNIDDTRNQGGKIFPHHLNSKLFYSIKTGNAVGVKQLLTSEYSPNIIYKGNTALNVAIYYNQIEIASYLMALGANPELKSPKYGLNAFEEAVDKPDFDFLGEIKIT